MRLAEAQKREMLLAYQQTIVNAFQEVSNSLIVYQQKRELPPGAHERKQLLLGGAQSCTSTAQ